MEIREVLNYLKEHLREGTMTITAEDTAAGRLFWPLLLILQRPFIMNCCRMEARPTESPSEVLLYGNISLGGLGARGRAYLHSPMNSTLLLRMQEEGLYYSLEAKALGIWTMEEFFGSLSPMYKNEEGFVVTKASSLAKLKIQNPVLLLESGREGFDFPFMIRGTLLITGEEWGNYRYLLGTSLPFEGALAVEGSSDGYARFGIEALAAAGFQIEQAVHTVNSSWIKNTGIRLCLESGVPLARGYDTDSISMAGIGVTLHFQGMETEMEFSAPLFFSDDTMPLRAVFPNGLGLADLLRFFSLLFQAEGSKSALLLPQESDLNVMKLYRIYLGVKKKEGRLRITEAGAQLRTSRPWKLPLSFLTLDDLELAWWIQYYDQEGKSDFLLTGNISAQLSLELPGARKLQMNGTAYLPELQLDASLKLKENQETVFLKDVIGSGPAGTLPGEGAESLELAQLELSASYYARSLRISVLVKDILRFSLGNLSVDLKQIYAVAAFTQRGNAYLAGGVITIGPKEGRGTFSLALEGGYAGGDWKFRGWLSAGHISLTDLITAFLPLGDNVIMQSVPQVVIQQLDMKYEYYKAGQSSSFSLETAISAEWGKILGKEVSNEGRILLSSDRQGLNYISVMLALRVNALKIAVQADNFHLESAVYHFMLQYREKTLRAAYFTKQIEEQPHALLNVSMQNITLGDIVSWIIGLINPNARFELPSPWDILNRIDLSKFNLIIDLTLESINFGYELDIDIIGLFTVKSLGLTYDYGKGSSGKVLFWVASETDTYSWDPLREAPPDTVQDIKKFRLLYLGLGQHFGTQQIKDAESIEEARKALEETFGPNQQELLQYDPQINWIFGAHFLINEALDVSIVLNDPSLYGILIKVDSNLAPFKKFYGLMLELLYKKVTKDIGMFRVMLQLPEKMRSLELGAVSLTIGVMSLEIYTNGNFLLDLGFPHNKDFSRSFAIQYGIYSGQGGFYFGLLSGATCPSLPMPVTGAFHSALSIGLGLKVGISQNFDFGIVAGGVSLELVGIFEGLFAVYDPGEGRDKACYYQVAAVAGIVGRVFIKVNLLVISLEGSAELHAFAMLALESYKASLVDLSVSISLKAKIRILFFKINVGYDFSHSFQFKLGSDVTAPWEEKRKRAAFMMKLFEAVRLSKEPEQLEFSVSPVFSMVRGALCAAFIPVMPARSYQKLVELFCHWMLHEFSDCPGRELPDNLTAERLQKEVDYSRVDAFLSLNARFCLCEAGQEAVSDSGGALPMPPPTALAFQETGSEIPQFEIAYWQDNKVSDDYAAQLRAYFERFDTMQPQPLPVCRTDASHPLAETVFLDFCHMLLRALMRQAVCIYDRYEIPAKDFSCAAARDMYGISLSKILADNLDAVLAPGELTVPSRTVAAGQNQTIADMADSMGCSAENIFEENQESLSVLREGAEVSLADLSYSNPAGLSAETAAILFFVRYGFFDDECFYLKYVEQIADQVPDGMEWEADGTDTLLLALPDGTKWKCLPGDTVERLARVCAVLEGDLKDDPVWKEYHARFVERNKGYAGQTLQIPSETVRIRGDRSLGALYRRLFARTWQKGNADQELLSQPVFCQNAPITVRNVTCILSEPATLKAVLEEKKLTIQELAEALEAADYPFEQDGEMHMIVSGISHIPKEQIQREILRPENTAALSAAASRFLLQGLRVPAPDSGGLRTLGLYEVLKQQIPFSPEGGEWALEVRAGEGSPWVQGRQRLVLKRQEVETLLPDTAFDWKERFCLEQDPVIHPFTRMNQYYTVKDSLMWAKPAEGGRLACVSVLHPFSQELKEAFPHMGRPVMTAGRDRETEIKVLHYGVLLAVRMRRTDSAILVEGVEPEERLLLEHVVQAGKSEELDFWMYYQTNPINGIKNTLVEFEKGKHNLLLRVNLSRETRMFPEGLRNDGGNLACAAVYGEMDFLRLIWEGSTVGGGGYYLCLENSPEAADFDEDGQGKFWLLVKDNGMLGDIVNCAVSAETVKAGQGNPFFIRDREDAPESKQQVYATLPPGAYGLRIFGKRPETDTQDLFSIFGYRIEGADYGGVRGKDSRPLIPADRGDRLVYEVIAPLSRMIENPDQNPYRVHGCQAAFRLYCRDVLGNVAPGELEYTVMPGINDCMLGLHVWPGVSLSYEIREQDGCRMILYLDCGEEEKSGGAQETEQLLRSLWQLESGCEIRISCTLTEDILLPESRKQEIMEFGRRLYQWKSGTGSRPEGLMIGSPVLLKHQEEDYFPLEIRLTVARSGASALPAEALRADSIIQARIPFGETNGIGIFAGFLEKAVSGVKLARRGRSGQDFYVIRTGAGGMIPPVRIRSYVNSYGCGEHAPVFYSLSPLANGPVSRVVQTAAFDREWKPILDQTEMVRYSDVDIDSWASRFLEDLEGCMEEGFAGHLAGFGVGDINAMMAAKEKLSDAIAATLIPLSSGIQGTCLKEARQLLKNRLRNSLVQGSRLSAVAEFQADAELGNVRLPLDINALDDQDAQLILHAGKLDLRNPCILVLAELQQQYRAGARMSFTVSIQDVEFNIRQSEDGYESSEWFRLVIPIVPGDGTGLLEADFASDLLVPNPLRRVPDPLIFKEQACHFTEPEDSEVMDASSLISWNHQIDVTGNAAEQDTHEITISYKENPLRTVHSDSRDLFDVLCLYDQVRERLLQAVMKEYNSEAFACFAALAGEIANLWKPVGHQLAAGKDAADELNCTVCYNDRKKQMELIRKDAGWGLSLITEIPGGGVRIGEKLAFCLHVAGLSLYTKNIARVQSVSVRNQDLLTFAESADDVSPPVAAPFIYRVVSRELPPLYAKIRSGRTIRAGSIAGGYEKEKIRQAIDLVWEKLELSVLSGSMDLALSYQYELLGDGIGATVRLPISLVPGIIPSQAGIREKLTEIVLGWQRQMKPVQKRFSFLFGITIYAKDGQRTLLSLEQLEVRFEALETDAEQTKAE